MAIRLKTVPYAFDMVATVRGSFVSVLINDVSVPSFTDETTDAMDDGTGDVPLATIFAASNDAIYFGSPVTFDALGISFAGGTNRTGGTLQPEYWNGSSWVSLTVSAVTGNANFTGGSANFNFTPPTDWATTSVNAVGPHYWVRWRVLTAPSTAGTFSFANMAAIAKPAAVTVHIPETTSRTFRSVFSETSQRARNAVAVFQGRASARFGSATPVYATDQVQSWAAGSEHFSVRRWWDLTDAFAAEFGSGASQTVELTQSTRQNGSATATVDQQNTAQLLHITYEAEEQTTRLTHNVIPIESPNGNGLTTGLVEQGTNQVPKLIGSGGFLPQDSVVMRDIHFRIFAYNHSVSGTGDYALGYALDAEAEASSSYTDGSISGTQDRIIWRRNDLDTSVAHAWKLRTTSSSKAFQWPGALLSVTYEYDHDASTRFVNYQCIAGKADHHPRMGAKTAQRSVHKFRFYIDAPGTLNLRQSGLHIQIPHVGTANNLVVKAGAQADRTYTMTQSAVTPVDDHSFVHRIDAGGAMGADALTLQQGWNEFTVELYTAENLDSSTDFGAASVVLHLNFESDIAATGADSHQHTVEFLLDQGPERVSGVAFAPTAPTIPESAYHIGNVSFGQITAENDGDGNYALSIIPESGEGAAVATTRWVQRMRVATTSANDWWNDTTSYWKQWPNQPNAAELFDVETTRSYTPRKHSGTSGSGARAMGLRMLVTYGVQGTWAGTVTGYTGDGSGLEVEVYRKSDNAFMGIATTAVGGTYSLAVPDTVCTYYSRLRQDATRLGSSDDGVAT